MHTVLQIHLLRGEEKYLLSPDVYILYIDYASSCIIHKFTTQLQGFRQRVKGRTATPLMT